MQNRYVADVGDFGKFGLLRALHTSSADHPGFSLAVLWYLFPDEGHNNDGRHIRYLDSEPGGQFERCDRILFSTLREIAKGHRTVAAVEASSIFRRDTAFHSQALAFARDEGPRLRREKREKWLRDALKAADKADVVFVDPDNGLECSVSRYAKNGPKYVYHSDLFALCQGDKSIVIYHHLSRQGKASEQVERQTKELVKTIPISHSIAALRFRRGSSRVFFLAVAPPHKHEMEARIRRFLEAGWAQHFVRDKLPLAATRQLVP